MGPLNVLQDMALTTRRILRYGQRGTRLSQILTYLRLWFRVPMRGKTRDRRRLVIGGRQIYYHDPSSLRFLYKEIMIERVYEFSAPSSSPLIIDCGTNIGLSVLFFKSRYPDSKIIAFEPNPEAFELLKLNVEANDLRDVTLRKEAVTSKKGSVSLYRDHGSVASVSASTIHSAGSGQALEVPSVDLCDEINGEVDLLKLDIEGAEADVLMALAKGKKLSHLSKIIMEFHHHLDPESDRLGAVLAELESSGFGYTVSAVGPVGTTRGAVQNIMVFAYRKAAAASA